MTDFEKKKFSRLITDAGVCTHKQSQQLRIGKYDWLILVRGKIGNWRLTDFANQPFVYNINKMFQLNPSYPDTFQHPSYPKGGGS